MDVIVGIGYGNIDNPTERESFAHFIRTILGNFGKVNAEINGVSYSGEWGQEDGTWFAVTFPTRDQEKEARARCVVVGSTYNQDAIAWTLGHTYLVECATTERARTAYRDFL